MQRETVERRSKWRELEPVDLVFAALFNRSLAPSPPPLPRAIGLCWLRGRTSDEDVEHSEPEEMGEEFEMAEESTPARLGHQNQQSENHLIHTVDNGAGIEHRSDQLIQTDGDGQTTADGARHANQLQPHARTRTHSAPVVDGHRSNDTRVCMSDEWQPCDYAGIVLQLIFGLAARPTVIQFHPDLAGCAPLILAVGCVREALKSLASRMCLQ